MKEVLQTVDDIEFKIRQLIIELQRIKEENGRLSTDLVKERQLVDTLKSRITKLEDENKVLRIAQTLTTGIDTTDTKNQIDQLVREIDKCISLLNG